MQDIFQRYIHLNISDKQFLIKIKDRIEINNSNCHFLMSIYRIYHIIITIWQTDFFLHFTAFRN